MHDATLPSRFSLLACRRTLLLASSAVLTVASAAMAQITVDGTVDAGYGKPLAIQDTNTQFGNNDLGVVDRANGSEIDGLHAIVTDTHLYFILTGNLESNFNRLDIFIDCKEGGQNTLRNDNANVNFNGLNRMGTSSTDPNNFPGLTFDAGFVPDFFLVVNGGGTPYTIYMDWAELLTLGGGTGGYAGSGAAGVENVLGPYLLGINNSNVGGVIGGNELNPGGGAGVTTGIEFGIPLEVLGYTGGALKISAFVNNGSHSFLSNQVIGGLGGGGNLGEPRVVNFATLAGDQFVTVVEGETGSYCGDPATASCCETSKEPFCSNAICCNAVCAVDPSCCTESWDSACADLAGQLCVACGGQKTCGGSTDDCNGNGLADGCDIFYGVSLDCNLDGIPDECQGEIFFCVDGQWSEEYGKGLAVQDTQTEFGNSDLGAINTANGSELDVAYAFFDEDHLHLLLAGNLESNYNKVEIFIDCRDGGQNTLRGDNVDVDFNGLNRMGTGETGPGLTFDSGFAADFYLNMGGGPGGDSAYDLYLNWATLPTEGGGTGGFGGPGDAGIPNAMPNGIMFSINNTNVLGVDGGSGLVPGAGAGVLTGMEIKVPLSLIDFDGGSIKVCAFVNSSGHDFTSNQVMAGIGGGPSLGDPRNVNFQAVIGDQFFVLGTEEDLCPADFNDDGFVNGADLTGLLGAWGTASAIYDLSGDGIVGGADLAQLLAEWGACP